MDLGLVIIKVVIKSLCLAYFLSRCRIQCPKGNTFPLSALQPDLSRKERVRKVLPRWQHRGSRVILSVHTPRYLWRVCRANNFPEGCLRAKFLSKVKVFSKVFLGFSDCSGTIFSRLAFLRRGVARDCANSCDRLLHDTSNDVH